MSLASRRSLVFHFYSFKNLTNNESSFMMPQGDCIVVGGGSYRGCLLQDQCMNNNFAMHASGVADGGTTAVEKGQFCFE